MLEEFIVDEVEGLTAISTMRRCRQSTPISSRFSTAMADQAGLTRKEGPWQSYPRRCLMMRARSWTLRDGFADVLRGLAIREEVEDYIEPAQRWPRTEVMRSPPRAQAPPARAANWERPRLYRAAATPSNGSAMAGGMAAADGVGTAEGGPGNSAPVARVTATAGQLTRTLDLGGTRTAASSEVTSAMEAAYTLANAAGGFVEVDDLDALRDAFERLLLDPHLSPAEVTGLWESNEDAREAIETAFGADALQTVGARVKTSRAYQKRHRGKQIVTGSVSTKPRGRPKTAPPPPIVGQPRLSLDPGCSAEEAFKRYHQRLIELQNDGAGKASQIVAFREANRETEQWVRESLPELMPRIDSIYLWAAKHAR